LIGSEQPSHRGTHETVGASAPTVGL